MTMMAVINLPVFSKRKVEMKLPNMPDTKLLSPFAKKMPKVMDSHDMVSTVEIVVRNSGSGFLPKIPKPYRKNRNGTAMP